MVAWFMESMGWYALVDEAKGFIKGLPFVKRNMNEVRLFIEQRAYDYQLPPEQAIEKFSEIATPVTQYRIPKYDMGILGMLQVFPHVYVLLHDMLQNNDMMTYNSDIEALRIGIRTYMTNLRIDVTTYIEQLAEKCLHKVLGPSEYYILYALICIHRVYGKGSVLSIFRNNLLKQQQAISKLWVNRRNMVTVIITPPETRNQLIASTIFYSLQDLTAVYKRVPKGYCVDKDQISLSIDTIMEYLATAWVNSYAFVHNVPLSPPVVEIRTLYRTANIFMKQLFIDYIRHLMIEYNGEGIPVLRSMIRFFVENYKDN